MKKRINRFIIAFLTLTLVVGMTACGKEAKIEKQLTLGETSIEAGDYVAAITAYEEVINLDKYEIAGYEGLVKAMVGDQRSGEEIKVVVQEVSAVLTELKESETGIPEEKVVAAESFYIEAANAFSGNAKEEVAILKTGVEVLGEESQLADTYETKAEELVDYYLAGNNLEEAKQFAEELAETLPSNTENEDLAEEVAEKADAEQVLVDILMTAKDYIDAKDWQALADFCDSEEMNAMKEKVGDEGNYKYIFDGGTTGFGIGYYTEKVYNSCIWYIGDYVDGLRNGNGGSYLSFNVSNGDLFSEIYEGDWVEDVPNGNGYLRVEDNGILRFEKEGGVRNGLMHGTFTETATESDGFVYTYTYQMIDGIRVEVEVEDWIKEKLTKGYYPYYIVYRTLDDGSKKPYVGQYLKSPLLEGVAPYRWQQER